MSGDQSPSQQTSAGTPSTASGDTTLYIVQRPPVDSDEVVTLPASWVYHLEGENERLEKERAAAIRAFKQIVTQCLSGPLNNSPTFTVGQVMRVAVEALRGNLPADYTEQIETFLQHAGGA